MHFNGYLRKPGKSLHTVERRACRKTALISAMALIVGYFPDADRTVPQFLRGNSLSDFGFPLATDPFPIFCFTIRA